MANPARLFDVSSARLKPSGVATPVRRSGPSEAKSCLAAVRPNSDVVDVEDELRQTDDALLRDLCAGDVTAFDTLCLSYAERMWRFAYSIVGSREGAQDVVQDVLLSVWERRATLEVSGSVIAYLLGACRRRALYYTRNRRTAERISQQWIADDVPGIASAPEEPLQALEREERRQLLARAIATLPDVRRYVVALRWDQQLGYDDIAQVMQITPEAARAHVSRAYRVLRNVLRELGMDVP